MPLAARAPPRARAQACKLSFSSHRLLPMGSYPRIADRKGVYELFGPVNKLYCAGYDRAMIAFLACLRVRAPESPPRQLERQCFEGACAAHWFW